MALTPRPSPVPKQTSTWHKWTGRAGSDVLHSVSGMARSALDHSAASLAAVRRRGTTHSPSPSPPLSASSYSPSATHSSRSITERNKPVWPPEEWFTPPPTMPQLATSTSDAGTTTPALSFGTSRNSTLDDQLGDMTPKRRPSNKQSDSENQLITTQVTEALCSTPPQCEDDEEEADALCDSPTATQSLAPVDDTLCESPGNTQSFASQIVEEPESVDEIVPISAPTSPRRKQLPVRPPQHPSIVKHRSGGQLVVKETLDATSGVFEDGSHMVNQYILRQELGRGSFGAVFLATDTEQGRDYAAKVFSKTRLRRKLRYEARKGRKPDPSEDSEDVLYLIRNEVAIMKKVSHPNVVALHEVLNVEHEDSLYMVMEYCRGGTLMEGATLCDDGVRRFTEQSARHYFRQLVVGIDYLHQNEIIHHDIKPDNILLTADRRTVKITDFGVSDMFAKTGDDTSSRSMGSPAFASPELCIQSRQGIGHCTRVSGTLADIWAMGVTLYFMIEAQFPFGDKNDVVGMMKAIESADFTVSKDWSTELQHLMKSILEKDVDHRITMTSLRSDDWLTMKGRQVLPLASENSTPIGPITDSDLRHSFRHAISSTFQAFHDVLEHSLQVSREQHQGRRRAFFKEFYRQISVRSGYATTCMKL